jgi:hypothetical protein
VFGPSHSPWERLKQQTGQELLEEWLWPRTICVLVRGRPVQEVLDEIAEVNEVSAVEVRVITPLPPGDVQAVTQPESTA